MPAHSTSMQQSQTRNERCLVIELRTGYLASQLGTPPCYENLGHALQIPLKTFPLRKRAPLGRHARLAADGARREQAQDLVRLAHFNP